MLNQLRTAIFGVQMPDREPDYRDRNGRIYWLVWNNADEGWADWHFSTNGRGNAEAAVVKLRWDKDSLMLDDVRVREIYRRCGLGSYLIKRIKMFAAEQGKTKIVGFLGSNDIDGSPYERTAPQPYLPGFYRRHGFTVQEHEDKSAWWGDISYQL